MSVPVAASPAIEHLARLTLGDIESLRASALARAADPSTRARILAQLDHAVAGVRATVAALAQEEAPDAP
jgi:hypothetical protein